MNLEELKKRTEELQAKFPKKYVKESFDYINKILSIETCDLSIPSIKPDAYKAVMSKNDKKGFTVLFEGINEFPILIKSGDWLESEIVLSKDDIKLKLSNVHVMGTGTEFKLTREEDDKYFTGSLKVKMHVERFSLQQPEKCFYRQILKMDSLDISRYLKTEAFNVIGFWHGDGLFRFSIDNIPYSLL